MCVCVETKKHATPFAAVHSSVKQTKHWAAKCTQSNDLSARVCACVFKRTNYQPNHKHFSIVQAA